MKKSQRRITRRQFVGGALAAAGAAAGAPAIAFRFTQKPKPGGAPNLVHFVKRYALSVAECY